MSGTSLDAVDAALVSFQQATPKLLATYRHALPDDFRKSCLDLTYSGITSLDDFARLDVQAGVLFAEAVHGLLQSEKLTAEAITAIASHGQTLRHGPNGAYPFTLQIGDPNVIAARTNIMTLADFRRRDVAEGGQGAPLAPAFHAALFHSPSEDRIVVNIGGLSNISYLPADTRKFIIGFDSGPGNCLLDSCMQKNWALPFDPSGSYAAHGQIHVPLLNAWLTDPYFKLAPPKSCGREYFNMEWADKLAQAQDLSLNAVSPYDLQATLTALTVQTISQAIVSQSQNCPVYICGGGAYNETLMQSLNQTLERSVQSVSALGVDPSSVEPLLMAWLAYRSLQGLSGNLPSVTGAKQPAVLGGIYGFDLKKVKELFNEAL